MVQYPIQITMEILGPPQELCLVTKITVKLPHKEQVLHGLEQCLLHVDLGKLQLPPLHTQL